MNIEKLAKASKIEIFEHEKESVCEKINTNLEIMGKIKDLSGEKFCPSFYSEELRKDSLKNFSTTEEVFSASAKKQENYFVVSRVVK